jgi:hypothetical protein
MTIEVDVQDKAGGFSKASAVEEALDRIERLGIKAIHVQRALDRGKHAGIIIENNYPFAADHDRHGPN